MLAAAVGSPTTRPLLDGAQLWASIFGNPRPVAIEIGPGRGEFLLAHARTHPVENLFAIERSPTRAQMLQRRLHLDALANARVLCADAACVIALLPDRCVAAYYIQFPDPWWKRRHQRRRLFTPALVADLRRTLTAGGTVELMTDVADYFAFAQQLLNADPALERVAAETPPAWETTFAHKARRRGAVLHRSVHRRVAGA